ncbi:MAG TPA: M24 family metallopeptidase, partial [Gemmatimonadales bacterium]
ITTLLPPLMRKYGIEMWVIPMREYNEDPVFTSLVSPTTFAARRRTIYVFHDRGPEKGVERIALGGSSQGGLYQAVRSTKPVSGTAGVAGPQAELWGDEQWQVLKRVLEERNPRVIGIDKSRTFAFSDGLSAGELEGMSEALGPVWTSRFRPVEGLAVDLIASRLPEEEVFYTQLTRLVWSTIEEMFSARTITPGTTRTSDLVWFWRQRINDLGLGTWFQPSIEVQRRGATAEQLGSDPVIQRGDVLHCDVGITALRLNTDTQHNAYVLLPGESEAPAGLRKALANANRLQDILFEEVRAGRSGNEILRAALAKMRQEGIDGTIYSHPIGMHGHGAGPLIGLWDYQDGVPGRGDHKVIPGMWYSSELQASTAVPEWGGQRVRMAMEEDFFVGPDGVPRWALKRQDALHIVR